MSQDGVSRRHFFFGSLLAGAVPLAGYGSVPSLRALGYKPFYDKLNVAAIGCGGQGGVDLNDAARTENIVALCDVDEARAEGNFKKFEKQPKYKDFRVMLEKEGKNIDAVTIGIPDFMHATVALACMQHGKHVYLEKPLTRTPWEARLLMEAAAKYKVATQMGNQGFSHECNRVAAEIVWSGAIGDVTEAHISTTPGTHPTGMQAQPPESAVPGTLDWQAWLGGAAMRPYSPYYTPYNWRGFLDFGTGQIGNWATHTAGPVQTALQLGAPTSLERVSVAGESSITYPDRATVRLDFPARGGMPPVKVFYHDGPHAIDPDLYHVPGMENETILPPVNNLARQGPSDGRTRRWGGGPGSGWGSRRGACSRCGTRRSTAGSGRSGSPGVRRAGGPVAARRVDRERRCLHRHEGNHGDLVARGGRLAAARGKMGGIRTAAAVAHALARPHAGLGARLQGRRSGMFRLQYYRALRGVAGPCGDCAARSGETGMGRQDAAYYE